MLATEKQCNKCTIVKPLQDFHRTNNPGEKFGRVGACKPCRSAHIKAKRLLDPTRERAVRMTSKNRRVYGLSPQDIQNMYDDQAGVCKICGNPDNTKRGCLQIDHCHTTGRVRGLLCHHCNILLGNARDNEAILQKAIAYLADSRGG